MSLAILCSGQGGQHAAMFALVEHEARAAPLIARANACAGFDLAAAVEAPSMFDNAIAQPLICAWQDIVWSMLESLLAAAGVAASMVAGYSVGELASHGCAGRLAWADVIALARTRAAVMTAAGDGTGLVAIRGPAVAALAPSLAAAGAFVAIVNGDDQCIVGGPVARLDALVRDVTARGNSAQRLPIGIAAHTPLLAGAVLPLRESLERCAWTPSRLPTIAGIDATFVRDAPTAIDRLARQVAAPIRWADCMDSLVEAGATVCLELGPGSALARLMRERHRDVVARSVEDFRSLDAVVDWVFDALA
jgi:[acyl-carrier-protein] S-malonyltransferase